jgi:transposase
MNESDNAETNRATLAVARKMVAHMLAVDRRKTDFIPEGKLRPTAA